MSWGNLYKLIPREPINSDSSTSGSPKSESEKETDEFIPLIQLDGTIAPTYIPLKRQTGGVISSKDFPLA